ncbi:MAG: cellulose synthase operon protein YhjQ [Pseudomonas sp.]|nr:cellulose synthase operon protein YhjQ [Pseudomonas sp.]
MDDALPHLHVVSAMAGVSPPQSVVDVEQCDSSVGEESVWSSAGLRGLLAQLGALTSAPAPAGAALKHLRVVAVVSAKGGVGKTTMSANLAAALQKAGKSVVAIDLDPQNALHQHFTAAQNVPLHPTALGIAQDGEDWLACGMVSACGVRVLPFGEIDESQHQALEACLNTESDWLERHLSAMDLAEGTVVLIDTPPGPSPYLRQALSVAHEAIVVSLADAASYTALPQIDKLIKAYTSGRETFVGASYLINQVDTSRPMNRAITQILRDLLGQQVLGVVHHDPAISDALAYNRNVLEFDPRGLGCHDILDCSQALTNRLVSALTATQ